MKRRIVLLGPPASGKGTQAHLLSVKFDIPTASTGAMLRREIAQGTPVGREAAKLTSSGAFVPDEVVLHIVSGWLDAHNDGFLLDGFPRTVSQAEALHRDLEARKRPLDVAFLFDLPESEIRNRVLHRLTCDACGSTFGEQLHGVREGVPCPYCGGVLTHRKDDDEKTLNNRLAIYREKTLPIVDFYKKNGLLSSYDATQSPEALFEKLCGVLNGGRQ
ncbi:MAG: nucleoside monophosphate kinase [Chthoniobacterales bacterium]